MPLSTNNIMQSVVTVSPLVARIAVYMFCFGLSVGQKQLFEDVIEVARKLLSTFFKKILILLQREAYWIHYLDTLL